jgi:CBS domain containing-hemolysin-like protein
VFTPVRIELNDSFAMNHALLSNILVWIGIGFCITQSAVFSGLNLALFSLSKLRLEVAAAGGNRDAIGLLELRKDSNLTLATVLWGNVTINVLLRAQTTLDSKMTNQTKMPKRIREVLFPKVGVALQAFRIAVTGCPASQID